MARRNGKALSQGLVLLGALAGLAGALLHARQAPFDAQTLKIQVEALQSQSAEVDAVAALGNDGTLSPRWIANHLEQLHKQVARTRDTLDRKPVPRSLAAEHARALRDADAIETRLVQRQHRPRAAP